MRRIKFIVAYDGTNYHGFAKQRDVLTVQGVLEQTFYTITQEEVEVIGAGRTDTGVHAKGQCCIVDTHTAIPTERLFRALNGRLPKDIVIKEMLDTTEDFHPRFMAKRKTYRYQILNTRISDPFLYKYAYFYHCKLDIQRMLEASQFLVGEHDFKCFCAAGSTVQSTVRSIYSVEITENEGLIQIDICGNGFLYNMVRIIAGTLIEVGRGKLEAKRVQSIIESKDRSLAGPTAPPQGLTMLEIIYN